MNNNKNNKNKHAVYVLELSPNTCGSTSAVVSTVGSTALCLLFLFLLTTSPVHVLYEAKTKMIIIED